jgi:hypothetical protein
VPTCRHCNAVLGSQQEKALSGEVAWVWANVVTNEWVCHLTGDEHCPKHLPCPGHAEVKPEEAPGTFVVLEGNPVDGFVIHGIPAFADHEAAVIWAAETCTNEWWVMPLQDVE